MKIVVAHDGSDKANKALIEGAEIAQKWGGSLTIVSVVPDLCLSSEEITQESCDLVSHSLLAEAQGLMSKVMDELKAKGVSAELVIKDGRPAQRVIEVATDLGADLIVVGSTGKHGAAKFFMGSVSTKIAEHAPMSVYIVR